MGIRAISLLTAAPTINYRAIGTSSSTSSNSQPSPSYGGSQSNFSAGLYSALGQMLAPDVRPTSADNQRNEILNGAATKLRLGDFAGARSDAESLLQRRADDVSALRLVGQTHLAEHNYQEAERILIKASVLAPNDARIRTELLEARTMQGSDEAVLAKARRKLSDPNERINGLRMMLRLADRSPRNTEVHLALADGFSAAGKPLQVIGALQEAVKSADKDQIDGVIARARAVVVEHPGAGIAHNLLGRALQKAGRFDAALSEFQAANNAVPYDLGYLSDLSGGYVARANQRIAGGELVSAKSDLHAAQRIDPGTRGLSHAFASLAAGEAEQDLSRGRYTSALTKLSTASAKRSGDPAFSRRLSSLYLRVGGHFESKGTDSAAFRAYAQAFQLDPVSQAARRKVGELGHKVGLAELNAKDYDDAIRYLDQAYQADRSNSTYKSDLARAYDLRGQRFQTLGKLSDAVADFKKAHALEPTNATYDTNLSTAILAVSTA